MKTFKEYKKENKEKRQVENLGNVKKIVESIGATCWTNKALLKKDCIELVKYASVIENVEILDTHGWYRDMVIFLENGECVSCGINSKTVECFKQMLMENNVKFSS